MERKNILKKYITEESNNGIIINTNNNELVIKGNKTDLIELADYIVDIALSDNKKDHIHIDENILISNESEIKELIIEKE